MDLLLRHRWTPDDLEAVRSSLHRHYRETQDIDKHWVRNIDPHHVYKSLADGSVSAVIADGFLIVFDVCVPWYNPGVRILNELLVLRIKGTPGDFRTVISALDILCIAYKCHEIGVGDALQEASKLARVYKRYGYTVQGTQLMKGNPNG